MKKIISAFLVLVTIFSMVLSVNVFAASYPSISSKKYIEFTAQENISVYKDTACKTRGTSSPAKKYNASVSKGDICYIYKITSSYVQLNYPTSSGRRTGYIKRSALFDKSTPITYISSAKARVSIYKSAGGSYIAKGDKVWHVDPKKGYEGYKAVVYEAKSGNRAYKMGYVKTDDLDKIKSGKTSNAKTKENKNNTVNAKVSVANIEAEGWKEILNDQKKAARSCVDLTYEVNKKLAEQKTLGVSLASVVQLDPTDVLGVFDEEAVIGIVAMSITEKYYFEALSSHEKFLKAIRNVSTEKQADQAFEYFVDATSKYKMILESNIDTVDRYLSKYNYRKDMLDTFFSTAGEALIPGSEYAELVKACSIVSTMSQISEKVEEKMVGYDAMKATRKKWYEIWNKAK